MKAQQMDLLNKIEDYRSRMVALALHSSFSDDKVVRISTELDELLNQVQPKRH
ncbi:RNA polymerase sigma factor SigW [Bacillus coahuilensis m2-6]|uniref:aspartyl-phosphate phosphatase Spo0E family protein n=1 Tax=Bacillus coahuilensis TaxID=408580 RepID=UPI0001850CA3|nr:aspartyl-phosphate phosphatase Spo0E family protein [Bacillus coahuilensis]KUP04477.1 RNA polymerase sigma factor SigW [Bacillus coahuilensis m2-6]